MQIAQNKKKLKKNLVINLLLLPLCIVLLILIFQIILSYERVFGFEIGPILLISIVILIFTIIILSSYSVVLSLKEYKAYFVHKSFNYSGRSRLTIQEIFDNENRRDIINAILEDPGIHNNELLRKCNIQKGQLQWHLDVLLKYNIIRKKKFGQYTIYFPVMNTIEAIDTFSNGLMKSETTAKIFELIQKNPGISSSEISNKIDLARNTVKYHVDKLSESNLILLKKKNRKIELYPRN